MHTSAVAFSILTCIARGFIRSSILSEQRKKLMFWGISFNILLDYPRSLAIALSLLSVSSRVSLETL